MKIIEIIKYVVYIVHNKKLADAYKDFEMYNEEKNTSKETRDFYSENFKYFSKFLGHEKYCYTITSKTIQQYTIYMRTKLKVKDTTIITRKRALRVFVNFWSSKNYMPKIKIEISNTIKYKETYTDEEISALLKYDENILCSFTTLRNWVITNYFLGTGNRLRTVVNIKTEDVNLDNGTVFLRAMKNDEPQNLPLCSTLTMILKSYIQIRNNLTGEYLFCTHQGKQLTKRGMQQAVSHYNKSRGVKKTSSHLFRHRYAKDFCLANGNIFKLQILLNHKTLVMSEHYARLYPTQLREDIEKSNPLDLSNKRSAIR